MLLAEQTRIEKHNDRLVFRNPGLLKLPIEQIYEGGVSYARNPKIQNMLRMVGYGENLGSGFPLILDAWKQSGWATPVLNNRFELDMVELVLPVASFSSSENDATNRASGRNGKKSVQKSVQIIVTLIANDPQITTQDIADTLGINRSGVSRHIKHLQENGIIRRVGPDKGGHWEIIDNNTTS